MVRHDLITENVCENAYVITVKPVDVYDGAWIQPAANKGASSFRNHTLALRRATGCLDGIPKFVAPV